MDGPLRFSEIAQAIPELSDRLLSERMKELEARGIVERTVIPGPPLRVQYELSKMGRELEPALAEIQTGRGAGSAEPRGARPDRAPASARRRFAADAPSGKDGRRPAPSNVPAR